MKIIKKEGKIHPALINAFSSLYGYTSDEDGIRHGMVHDPNLTAAESKILSRVMHFHNKLFKI